MKVQTEHHTTTADNQAGAPANLARESEASEATASLPVRRRVRDDYVARAAESLVSYARYPVGELETLLEGADAQLLKEDLLRHVRASQLVQRHNRIHPFVANACFENSMRNVLEAEFFDEAFGKRLAGVFTRPEFSLGDLVRDPRAVLLGEGREEFEAILGVHLDRAASRMDGSAEFCDEVIERVLDRGRDPSGPPWPRPSRPMRLDLIDPDSPGTSPAPQIDGTKLNTLVESMMQVGQLEPIRVRFSRDFPDYSSCPYEILDGLHRFMAARKLGWRVLNVVEDLMSEVDGAAHVTSEDIEEGWIGRDEAEDREARESSRFYMYRSFVARHADEPMRNPWLAPDTREDDDWVGVHRSKGDEMPSRSRSGRTSASSRATMRSRPEHREVQLEGTTAQDLDRGCPPSHG